jgi:UDP-N-acetylglucosamine acyltransferase
VIDPRAIIDPSAIVNEDAEIGPWTTIGADVVIGDSCRIAPHVVIDGPTQIGRGAHIFQFASIGGASPELSSPGASSSPDAPGELLIGDDNTFREGVTVHRGTEQTTLGDHNLLMPGAHVGHDCMLGSHICMANNSAAYGHVTIGDYAEIGGGATISRNRTIGAWTRIGAMSLIADDVPAYLAVSGHPASVTGINVDGLRGRRVAAPVIAALCDAYRTVYRDGLRIGEALDALRDPAHHCPEVKRFLESVSAR